MLTAAELDNLARAADAYANELEAGPEATYWRELAIRARDAARRAGYTRSTDTTTTDPF